MGFAEEWAAAEPLPELPAHPRCRCTIRSIFRDLDGNVFGTATTTAQPAPPEDGVIAQAEQAAALYDEKINELGASSAIGNAVSPVIRNAIARGDPSVDPVFVAAFPADQLAALQANRDYWRSVEITPEVMNDITADMARFTGFMNYRYGTSVDAPASERSSRWFDQPQRIEVLKSIERIRSVEPRYVTDSQRFATFRLMTLGGTTLASCANDGTINYDAHKGEPYISKGIRAQNPNVSGIEEIIVHELGHSVANRYGEPHWNGSKGITYGRTLDTGPYSFPLEQDYIDLDTLPGAQSLGPDEVEKALAARQRSGTTYEISDKSRTLFESWEKIRTKTSRDEKALRPTRENDIGYINGELKYQEGLLDLFNERIATAEREREELQRKRAELAAQNEREPGTLAAAITNIDYEIRVRDANRLGSASALNYAQARIAKLVADKRKAEAAAAKAAANPPKSPDQWSTSYGKSSPWEDWAESFMLFQLNPDKLRKESPSRYEYMKANVFAGKDLPQP